MSALASVGGQSTQASAQTCVVFTVALGAGELERATSYFARDSALITPDLTVVHGPGIRSVAQLFAVRAEIAIEASSFLDAGDIILARQCWRISSAGTGKGPPHPGLKRDLAATSGRAPVEARDRRPVGAGQPSPAGKSWSERKPEMSNNVKKEHCQ